jgi:hypothetical protein
MATFMEIFLRLFSAVSIRLLVLSLMLFFCSIGMAMGSSDSSKFSVVVNGLEIDLPLFSIFTVPDETIEIRIKENAQSVILRSNDRLIAEDKPGYWALKAPDKTGLYRLNCYDSQSDSAIQINVFVGEPLERVKDQKLEQYRIGEYPPLREINTVRYENPEGLVRVTREIEDVQLTPHFSLRQFLCKQQSGYPKFVVVQEKLLLLLEELLAEVNHRGYNIKTFGFISGYRTPFYNHKIRNVKYSRHIYGDAADIFIDTDNNDRMDDLNGDGKIDISDARVLYDITDNYTGSVVGREFKGGLGKYTPTAFHSGFVHVDTRGYRVRW